jgi:ABC-type lipoprotein export system ATPase subunit
VIVSHERDIAGVVDRVVTLGDGRIGSDNRAAAAGANEPGAPR